MTSPSAVQSVTQSQTVPLPDPLLNPIRTDLLNALLLSGSATNTHEHALANATFLRALAQSHALCYRASFHVIINHRGHKSVDVAFSYDPELEF